MSEPPLSDLPREVLLDLLAIYAAGEASPATRAFVEACLARDPDLARRAREAAALPGASLPVAALPPDFEVHTLRRTRGALALQRWLFALAITFTAIGLSLEVDFGGSTLPRVRLLILDHPRELGACLAIALGLWIAYRSMRGRLRAGGL